MNGLMFLKGTLSLSLWAPLRTEEDFKLFMFSSQICSLLANFCSLSLGYKGKNR